METREKSEPINLSKLDRPSVWRDTLVISFFVMTFGFLLGFWSGYHFAQPEDIPRKKAWDVSVVVNEKCRELFSKGKSSDQAFKTIQGCEEISDVVLNEVYGAHREADLWRRLKDDN